MMIKSFGNASTARFFEKGKNKFSGIDEAIAHRRLAVVAQTTKIEDLYAVGRLRLHKLSGNLAGFWSIDINGPWRLVFQFQDGDAFEVMIIDPH
jgi:proteic killer suppression protein